MAALDDTRFFDSEAINCSGYSTTVLGKGSTSYYHGVLTAAVVAPGLTAGYRAGPRDDQPSGWK
jgi:hypothetical protein